MDFHPPSFQVDLVSHALRLCREGQGEETHSVYLDAFLEMGDREEAALFPGCAQPWPARHACARHYFCSVPDQLPAHCKHVPCPYAREGRDCPMSCCVIMQAGACLPRLCPVPNSPAFKLTAPSNPLPAPNLAPTPLP